MKSNNPLFNSVPAANDLRKVPGFSPLKFLRRVTSSQTGEKVWKLELPYKRLWFRLACPTGRMVVKPLRITDQLAVFEALVYAQKEDEEPLSRFTASVSPEEAPDGKYVEAAQDSALNTALENAGFGVQLCDFVQSTGSGYYGSEIPVSMVTELQSPAATKVVPTESTCKPATVKPVVTPPVAAATEKPAAAPSMVTMQAKPSTNASVIEETTSHEVPSDVPPKPVIQREPTKPQEPISMVDTKTLESHTERDFSTSPAEVKESQPTVAEPANLVPPVSSATEWSASEQTTVVELSKTEPAPVENQTATGYTADMTVEEICQRMTMEQARTYVVQGGVCKGWSLEQVAERRAPSLKFYVCSDTGDNVLKAAATLMLQEINQRKAG